MISDIVKSIGSATYDEVFSQYCPRLICWHIFLPEMNSISPYFFNKVDMVIYDKCSPGITAHLHGFDCNRAYLLDRGILHPELNPAAPSLKSQPYRIQI